MILLPRRRIITPESKVWTPDRMVRRLVPGIIAGQAGGGGGVDPYFGNVKALLHFDGADGGTSTTDVIGHTVVINTTTTLRTAAAKFGSTGARWTSGSGTFITPVADFQFGTADFTVEGWWFFPTASSGVTSHQCLLSCGDNGTTDYAIGFFDFGASRFLYSDVRDAANANIGNITGSTPFPLDTWTHVALTRASGAFSLFMGGVLQGTNSSSAAAIRATALTQLRIGNLRSGGSAASWRGDYDEIRVTSGVARYTANFTPPAAAFPNA